MNPYLAYAKNESNPKFSGLNTAQIWAKSQAATKMAENLNSPILLHFLSIFCSNGLWSSLTWTGNTKQLSTNNMAFAIRTSLYETNMATKNMYILGDIILLGMKFCLLLQLYISVKRVLLFFYCPQCLQPNMQSKPQKEGSESEQFWKLLGGKSEYPSQKTTKHTESDPHLFSCTFSKGWSHTLWHHSPLPDSFP